MIGQDAFRIETVFFLVFFHRRYQIGALVVGFPSLAVDEGVAVDEADAYFCPEFHRCVRLAADDRADMRLTYAYNAFVYRMYSVLVHVALLFVQIADGVQPFLLGFAQLLGGLGE